MSHATRAHARFAPSAAHRWVNCTGSVSLCETVPNKSTPAAEEGTKAHEIAEKSLDTGCDPSALTDDEEMAEGVRLYVDYVREIMDQCETFAIEARLDITHIHPEMFGTGDFIGYDEQNKRLHVVDFKFGRVAVSPEENYQGLAYAMGAVRRYSNRKIEDIYITIIQPRVSKVPLTWTTNRDALRVYEDTFATAAAEADLDLGFRAGDWCKYCPAAAICPTARDKAHEIARAEFGPKGMTLPDVATLTRDDLGEILSKIDQLEAWCKQVKNFAFEEAINGRPPTGTKLVAKRAVRKWVNQEAADIALEELGIWTNERYVQKLISPAAAEKLVGKEGKKALASHWEKVSSGIKLVPESAPGDPIAPDAALELSKVEIDE